MRSLRLPIVGRPVPEREPASGAPGPDVPAGNESALETRAAPTPDLRDDDLHGLMTAFYVAVEADPLLAPYFISLDMREHMPRIVGFWSTMLFHTGRYTGNAFQPHARMPGLTAEHFAHWVATLERTIDSRFAGANASRMKDLAHRIAYSMQVRLGIVPFAEFPSGT